MERDVQAGEWALGCHRPNSRISAYMLTLYAQEQLDYIETTMDSGSKRKDFRFAH